MSLNSEYPTLSQDKGSPDPDKIVLSLGYNFRKGIFLCVCVKYHTVYGAICQEMFKLPDNFFVSHGTKTRRNKTGELNLRS